MSRLASEDAWCCCSIQSRTPSAPVGPSREQLPRFCAQNSSGACLASRSRHLRALLPMLCQPGAPNSTRHEPILIQASTRTKASQVQMVCETGALRITSICIDCSRHLGDPRCHWCWCCASKVPPDTQGMNRCWSRHPLVTRPRWCRLCARQVPQSAQAW